MKTLVFQINIPPKGQKTSGRKNFQYSSGLYDLSNERAKEYADKVGADYFCLDKDDWLGSQYAPCYHKLYLYNIYHDYDKIFYVDSDAIITKICPDIFQFDTLSAVLDCTPHTESGQRKIQRKNTIHKLHSAYNYFCSGVILFDQKFFGLTKDYWREELAHWKDIKNGQWDQSVFNVLVAKYYGDYNVLDYDWGAHWRRGKYIVHYGGPAPKLEWEKTIKKFEKFEGSLV